MSARVVYAYGLHHNDDSATPYRIHWWCQCGGDGVDIPGDHARCSSCGQLVMVPDGPMDARASALEHGTDAPPISTAWKLAAYREELRACGFAPADIRGLVLTAARNMPVLKTHPWFEARAEPVAPIARIDNHEPGSPEDLAARLRAGLDEDKR